MKTTDISYCQVCHKDFVDGEHCIYVRWDNNVICVDCYRKSTIAEFEPRRYKITCTN